MKKIITLAVLTTVLTSLVAQAPSKFNYQAVVRNSSGIVVANGTNVSFRFTIRDGSSGGTIIYRETQSKTINNAFGMVTAEVGSGTLVQGVYPSAVQWASGAKFLQVEVDPTGGNSYADMGAVQINSVPYANFSAASNLSNTALNLSGTISHNQIASGGGTNGQVLKFNGTNWVPQSDSSNAYFPGNGMVLIDDTLHSVWKQDGNNIYNSNTGNVGIGTIVPNYKLDVQHGGSTGMRIKSTSSFSVLDIDAQSGDAAIRFMKDGVNQWNLRNRPVDNYFELFELGGGGSRLVVQDGTGNLGVNNGNPLHKMDVGGSINTSDNLYVAQNAGFGTTSPLGPFHIKKSSNNQFALNGSKIAFDPTDKTFDDSATFIIHSSLELGVGAQTSLIAMGSDNGNYSSNLLFYTRGTVTTDDPTEKMRITSAGNVGIGMTPNFQLQVSTNSAAKPTSSAWTVPSDRRLKDEVGSFTDGLNVIMAIRPVKFRYNGLLGLPSEEVGIGTIAQELQEVAPYMVKINPSANRVNPDESKVNGMPNVKTSEVEYLCVDYGAMNFVLINAIKEQQAQIEELSKEIEILKAKK